MENSILKLGAYLPIFIALSLLIFAFANVNNERFLGKISRQCLYCFSTPMYLISFVGYVLYLSNYNNQNWIIVIVMGVVISAAFATIAEMFFKNTLKK